MAAKDWPANGNVKRISLYSVLSNSQRQELVSQAASPGVPAAKDQEYEFGDNVPCKIPCGNKMEEAQFSVVC